MTRPYVFMTPTRLWHPINGWVVFGAGETDPGGAWSEREGGDPPTTLDAGMAADLAAAHDQIEALDRVVSARDFDIAMAAKGHAEALAAGEAMGQRLRDAEAAAAQALQTAREVTAERDRLAQVVTTLQAKLAADAPAPAPKPETATPEDWRTLPFLARRALARRLSGDATLNTKADVERAMAGVG